MCQDSVGAGLNCSEGEMLVTNKVRFLSLLKTMIEINVSQPVVKNEYRQRAKKSRFLLSSKDIILILFVLDKPLSIERRQRSTGFA